MTVQLLLLYNFLLKDKLLYKTHSTAVLILEFYFLILLPLMECLQMQRDEMELLFTAL